MDRPTAMQDHITRLRDQTTLPEHRFRRFGRVWRALFNGPQYVFQRPRIDARNFHLFLKRLNFTVFPPDLLGDNCSI